MVATKRPPIIVIAIGPQNTERDNGIMARIAARAVSTSGRRPSHGRLDGRIPAGEQARCNVGVDLIDEHDRVAHVIRRARRAPGTR